MPALLSGATTIVASGAGSIATVRDEYRSGSRPVDVYITGGTATVRIIGRSDASLPWRVIQNNITATGTFHVPMRHFVSADITAISGATVTVELDAP
jgi:hypothetical protein